MFCLGGFWQWGFCPGGFCLGVYVWGVFVWGFLSGGFCPRTSKRLAAINCKKREAKKREEQVQLERTARRGFAKGVNQYYGIGAVIAVGVIGGLGCYIYRSKKGQVSQEVPNRALQAPAPPQQSPRPQTNKFEMD